MRDAIRAWLIKKLRGKEWKLPSATLTPDGFQMFLDLIDHGELKIHQLTADMLDLNLLGLAYVDTKNKTIHPSPLGVEYYNAWLDDEAVITIEGVSLDVSATLGNSDVVSLGDRGQSVLMIKDMLRQCHFTHIPPSDLYDSRTAAAVEEFQRSRNLPAHGAIDANTLTALLEEVQQTGD